MNIQPAELQSVKDKVVQKINNELNPIHFEVVDDTVNHASGHPDRRAHLALTIKSARFEGLNTMQQHRLVYSILAEELAGGLHALSLKTSA